MMKCTPRKDNWRDQRGRMVVCTNNGQGKLTTPLTCSTNILDSMPTDLAEICQYITKADYKQLDKVWVQLAIELMHDGCSMAQMAALLCSVRDCFREAIDDQAVDAVRMERWKFEKQLQAERSKVREKVKHEAVRVVKRQRRAEKAGDCAGTT